MDGYRHGQHTIESKVLQMERDSSILLGDKERKWIESARTWVKGHFAQDADTNYVSIENKLIIIETILDNRWVTQQETWKLQALGIAFGDALAQQLMLDWVTVNDEYGCDPALNWPGTSIFSFPLTMISKRIEQDGSVDVQELFDATCFQLNEMTFSGRSL